MSGHVFRTDAIALSSPSGRISRRARREIQNRIALQLFGPKSGFAGFTHVPTEEERRASRINVLRSRIASLRTACANQLSTGRPNKVTRTLAAAEFELASLLTEERL